MSAADFRLPVTEQDKRYGRNRYAMTTGKYYTAAGLSASVSTPTQNRLRVFPFTVDRTATFDRMATEVTTAVAATLLRWTVHVDNGSGIPGALVLDTGAVGDASTVGVKEATVSLTLTAGVLYWLGCVPQGGNPGLRHHSGAHVGAVGLDQSEISLGVAVGFYQSSIAAAAPDPFVPAGASANAPQVWLRKAA